MLRKFKIFYITLTSITIILCLLIIFKNKYSYNLFEPSYYLTLLCFYITGIAIIIKAIFLFKEENITPGIALSLVGVSLLIFTRIIVNFIYGIIIYF